MSDEWTPARIAALDRKHRAQRETEARTAALAEMILDAWRSNHGRRFRPPPRSRVRPNSGLCWSRTAPTVDEWIARPHGAGFVRLVRIARRVWMIERLPFWRGDPPERMGCYPSLRWALERVSPSGRHYFENTPRF